MSERRLRPLLLVLGISRLVASRSNDDFFNVKSTAEMRTSTIIENVKSADCSALVDFIVLLLSIEPSNVSLQCTPSQLLRRHAMQDVSVGQH